MSITKSPIIEQLTAGMQLIYDGNRLFTVDDDLAINLNQAIIWFLFLVLIGQL